MKRSNKLFLINIFLAIFFLLGLFFFDKLIGGNATNGKIENNIYYVKDALGNFNIVSKLLFILNYVILFRLNSILFFVSLPLALELSLDQSLQCRP